MRRLVEDWLPRYCQAVANDFRCWKCGKRYSLPVKVVKRPDEHPMCESCAENAGIKPKPDEPDEEYWACLDCGASGGADDFHACQGRPGDTEGDDFDRGEQ